MQNGEISGFENCLHHIQNVLNSSSDKNGLELLKEEYNRLAGNEAEKRMIIDQALRECFFDSNDTTEELLDVSVEAARIEMASANLPSILLSDLYDSLTTNRCESLFHLVENRVETWKEEIFFNACKNNLLRLCNDLLRRLSQSQNTVFCGRILLFLAKFFPFSERSGLNIASEFNVDNLTIYNADDEDIEETEHTDTGQSTVKSGLYKKFWHLQEFFRCPNLCYSKSSWSVYVKNTEEVLDCFTGYKLSNVILDKSKQKKESAELDQQYFAKYLSNKKLLDLQLSDSNFRRYILLQFLILHQYLTTPVKFKSDSHVLTQEENEWIKKTTSRVYKLIEETPPDGAEFLETIKHILNREEHWNNWKNEGCQPSHKPTETTTPESTPNKSTKRKLGAQVRDNLARKKYHLGSVELNRLWNQFPDNLTACRAEERNSLPTLKEYFQEALEEADPRSGIEQQYKKVHNIDYSWRALRLLAKRSPLFFEPRNTFFERTSDYVEDIITKIMKEFPQKEDSGNEVAVADDEEEELEPPSQNTKSPTAEVVTEEQAISLANQLGEHWKKLAPKLGLDSEQIEEIENSTEDVAEQAEKMLFSWIRIEKEDAIPEELMYNLQGLGLDSLAKDIFPSAT